MVEVKFALASPETNAGINFKLSYFAPIEIWFKVVGPHKYIYSLIRIECFKAVLLALHAA